MAYALSLLALRNTSMREHVTIILAFKTQHTLSVNHF